MNVKECAKIIFNAILKRRGYQIIKSCVLYDWQRCPQTQPIYNESILPENAKSYLTPKNPRLQQLKERYQKVDSRVTDPLVWKEGILKPDEILYFRGDNAFVWQLRGHDMNEFNYCVTVYYVKSIDKLGLLDKLVEDEFFGNLTVTIDNKLMSRDLLDSIIEIYFLEKYLNISASQNVTILDIGAGYGRLAHRMLNALPNIKTYFCTDAFAASTFISEYYVNYRKLEDRAKVIPLDNIEDILKKQVVDIALNIHSFPECTLSAIDWWLSLLEKHRVKYLMIVPHARDHGIEPLTTNNGKNFKKIIEKHGYKLIVKEPKYRDPVVQKYGINSTYHYLFEFQQ